MFVLVTVLRGAYYRIAPLLLVYTALPISLVSVTLSTVIPMGELGETKYGSVRWIVDWEPSSLSLLI